MGNGERDCGASSARDGFPRRGMRVDRRSVDAARRSAQQQDTRKGLAMMNMLDKFCSKLKMLGIYDNSIIVVMADHGHYEYHQNPVFMVKGLGEEHEFAQSDICFSYENLQHLNFLI
jgi:arylsulfatase A-like enzyme